MLRRNSKSYLQRVVNYSNIAPAPAEVFAGIQTRRGNIYSSNIFYRAMLCIVGTSHGPVSVRPSVTSRCSTKTAKRRITKTTPHDTPGNLVY